MPFHLRFTLTRRQRLHELLPWLPAVAGTTGFGVGVAYLASVVSVGFLALLLLPVVMYRGLFALMFGLAFRPGRPVEVEADADGLTVLVGGDRRRLPHDDIIQVFRAGDAWTVLHLDGSSLTIPAGAISAEQLDFLKSFALRAATGRRAEHFSRHNP